MPLCAMKRAVSKPMPLLAPVTRANLGSANQNSDQHKQPNTEASSKLTPALKVGGQLSVQSHFSFELGVVVLEQRQRQCPQPLARVDVVRFGALRLTADVRRVGLEGDLAVLQEEPAFVCNQAKSVKHGSQTPSKEQQARPCQSG